MAAARLPRVLVSRPFRYVDPHAYLRGLAEVTVCPNGTRAEIEAGIRDAEGFVVRLARVDEALLAQAPRLQVIANHGAGYDNIDAEAATRRGIWVANARDVVSPATADITMALLLCVMRRVPECLETVRAGKWTGSDTKDGLEARDVTGKTLGIVGLGSIGRAVARRARGFDMQLLYHQRNRVSEEEERALGVEYASKDDLLQRSDVVSLHVPLTPETRHLLSDREFEIMKPGAVLVNTARGAVVHEEALVRALESGRLAGAGLDVTEEEPRVHPGLLAALGRNVVVLPHVGVATRETKEALERVCLDNVAAVLRGRPPLTPVNAPAVPAPAADREAEPGP